ncbi:putative reverse transcriptase domain-containing protein, partial [Tanacetum coccineum]
MKQTKRSFKIKQRIQATCDRQKGYADVRRKPLEFQVGDRVMLKVSPWKGVIRFGKRGKLNPRVHSTFHISNSKKCLSNEPLAIPLHEIHIDDELNFVEEPVEIMDREVNQLKKITLHDSYSAATQFRGVTDWYLEPRLVISSDNISSVVTYTSISSDSDGPSLGIPLMNAGELLEMEPYEEVAQQRQAAPLSPAYVPDPMELEHHILVHDIDDDAEDEEEEEESSDDDDEEEEHLASVVALSAVDPIPSAEETKPFETDESAATPPPAFYTTSRIADIPEADLPHRKRLLLTAPTPRFKIGESSTVAAARQPRATVARRVDYGFVDTLDASIHASELKAMAVVESVHLRVNYQASVHRWESEEFQTHHQDAQDDRAALRDEAYHHKWQRQDADDRATGYIMRIQALEAGARIDTLEDTGNDRPRCCGALGSTLDVTCAGMTKTAMILERVMETVFRISNCTVENQIKFATYTLLGSALTWWNSHVRTVGHDVAYAMTWTNLKKMITDNYCPRGEIKKLEIEMWNLKVKGTDVVSFNQRFQELALMCDRMFPKDSDKIEKYVGGLPDMIHGSVMASKPKTMQDAIEFATELMDKKISTFAERQADNKRNPTNANNNNQRAPRANPRILTCLECGAQGHFKKYCPKLKNKNQGNQARVGNVVARAYAIGSAETNLNANVVT